MRITVRENRKSERVDFGARTISIPIGTFHSYDLAQDVANRITSACDYIEADARQQGHRTDEWVTVLTFEPKYFRDFKSYYTENYDSYCYMVTSTRDDFIRPDELEVRAYKSESRKNEGLNKDDKETLSVLALRDGVLDKVWKVLDEAADKAATELANASDVEWEDAYVAAAKMLLGAVQKDGARRLR